jgi:hypothetical protein
MEFRVGTMLDGLARTSPVAGRTRVKSFAVPPGMYSWGWRMGWPGGAHGTPGGGIGW